MRNRAFLLAASLHIYFLAQEFCNKGTLSDAVERGLFRRKHSLFDVDYSALIKTGKEVASAMAYLHTQDILHGDLTGNNVMLSSVEDGTELKFVAKVLTLLRCKSHHTILNYLVLTDLFHSLVISLQVLDFGFSRMLEKGQDIKTKSYGTITHTPPELLLDGTLSKAADVRVSFHLDILTCASECL